MVNRIKIQLTTSQKSIVQTLNRRYKIKVHRNFFVVANNLGLEKIPDEIFELTDIGVIDLSNNKIKEIPDQFYTLKNLEVINLSRNKISFISEKVGNFEKLTVLNLYKNNLNILPNNLGSLINLKKNIHRAKSSRAKF